MSSCQNPATDLAALHAADQSSNLQLLRHAECEFGNPSIARRRLAKRKKWKTLATQPGRRRIFIWDAVLRVIQYNGQGRQHVLDGVTITA